MSPFVPCFAALTAPAGGAGIGDAGFGDAGIGDALTAGLGCGYTVATVERHASTVTLVDSADHRLAAAGVDLAAVERGEWVAVRGDATDEGRHPARWPALLAELEPGPVREAVRKPLGVRALVPLASARVRGTALVVRNEDEKIVARVVGWTGELLAKHLVTEPRDLPVWVQVFDLRGYRREARAVVRALTEAGFAKAHETWFDLARDVAGIDTSGAAPRTMRADEPADRAVAAALLTYLDEIESNVDGTIVGVDTEHLHDLRVAVRRTRSVLKLLGDTLPAPLVERGRALFADLGTLTTPTRDLDVYLLDMDGLAARVARPDDLAVFRDLVYTRRASEHRKLTRALRSERLRDELSAWRDDLDRALMAPSTHTSNAGDLAADRVRHAFARTAKRARAISAKSPPEKVHALRKSAKELRYLLEVFAPLADPKAYRDVVADVKKLQDVLGRFQDAEVQSVKLREFAQEMLDSTQKPSANAILTMGDLAGGFDEEQLAARADLDAHHARYLGKRAARNIEKLVPTP